MLDGFAGLLSKLLLGYFIKESGLWGGRSS